MTSGTIQDVDGLEWPEGWRVELGPLPKGFHGLTYFQERRTVIAQGLHPWQLRATLIHENIHAVDGPVPRYLEEVEELRVHRATARRLISDEALLAALAATDHAEAAAEMLEVPVSMVWARLQGLSEDERTAFARALGPQVQAWSGRNGGRKRPDPETAAKWRDAAQRALEWLAESGKPFDAYDLTELGVPDPDRPNRWGPLFRDAAQEGLIKPVGFTASRRPSRAGGACRVWVGRWAA